MKPHRIGEMIELLPQSTGSQLTKLDVLLLSPHKTMPPSQANAENDLQRYCWSSAATASRTRPRSIGLAHFPTPACSLRIESRPFTPTIAGHFGDPIRVVTVQLGGSLAGKLSFRLSSILSSDSAALCLADAEGGPSRIDSSLERPDADRRDRVPRDVISRASRSRLMEWPCSPTGV
jgi:hypothetical protein